MENGLLQKKMHDWHGLHWLQESIREYDMMPHSWIFESVMLMRVAHDIKMLFKNSMETEELN